MNKPKPGEKYIHFKGIEIEIIAIARHTETEEELVVYKHGDEIWARPIDMFLSKVDKEKYPDVKQVYRFEKKDEN